MENPPPLSQAFTCPLNRGKPTPAPLRLRLRHSAGELTDGAGLLLVRRLWDRLGLGQAIDTRAAWLRGAYRPSLLVELWIVRLLYGGGRMDDLSLLRGRGIRRLFGWQAVPDPTTFGRLSHVAAASAWPGNSTRCSGRWCALAGRPRGCPGR
jgi:hypothetical protein